MVDTLNLSGRGGVHDAEETQAVLVGVPEADDRSGAFGPVAGVRRSTGSVGDAYDNAMCESFERKRAVA